MRYVTLNIITKIKTALRRIFFRRPRKKEEAKDLLTYSLLEREYKRLLAEREKIKKELSQLEDAFFRGEIDEKTRDRYYREKLSKAARLSYKIIEVKNEMAKYKGNI